MKAFIIAAGEGTRLWPLTTILPKALLPVGNKPISRYIVERLARQGFKDIVFCINKNFEGMFKDYFEDGNRFGVKIEYSVSDSPLGTAGEVLNARSQIDGPFLVYYGDELTNIDLKAMVEAHMENRPMVTLAVVRGIPIEVGVIELDDKGMVKSFLEKPPLDKPSWAGIAVMESRILDFIEQGDDFAKDVFPRLLKNGEKLMAYVSDARWLDIGTLTHWKLANKLAEKGLLE
jgi:mannose-1-phosphate guanylyltransferase/phosphomannomutase